MTSPVNSTVINLDGWRIRQEPRGPVFEVPVTVLMTRCEYAALEAEAVARNVPLEALAHHKLRQAA